MKPYRVSLLVGTCIFAAFVVYAYTAEPNHYADGTSGVHLGETMFAALFMGATAFLGCFLALRAVRPERLSLFTALAIAGGYLVVTALVNLIPMRATIDSDDTIKIALGLTELAVFCTAVPYLVAVYVRSRLQKSA